MSGMANKNNKCIHFWRNLKRDVLSNLVIKKIRKWERICQKKIKAEQAVEIKEVDETCTNEETEEEEEAKIISISTIPGNWDVTLISWHNATWDLHFTFNFISFVS